jgi:hypothetical protein
MMQLIIPAARSPLALASYDDEPSARMTIEHSAAENKSNVTRFDG